MPTFTWIPAYAARLNRKPRILEATFGDGYVQRAADGINVNPQSWSLTFSGRSDAEADAIESFLNTQLAVTAFDWTPPGKSSAKFRCVEWSRSYDTNNGTTITATFDEVFE